MSGNNRGLKISAEQIKALRDKNTQLRALAAKLAKAVSSLEKSAGQIDDAYQLYRIARLNQSIEFINKLLAVKNDHERNQLVIQHPVLAASYLKFDLPDAFLNSLSQDALKALEVEFAGWIRSEKAKNLFDTDTGSLHELISGMITSREVDNHANSSSQESRTIDDMVEQSSSHNAAPSTSSSPSPSLSSSSSPSKEANRDAKESAIPPSPVNGKGNSGEAENPSPNANALALALAQGVNDASASLRPAADQARQNLRDLASSLNNFDHSMRYMKRGILFGCSTFVFGALTAFTLVNCWNPVGWGFGAALGLLSLYSLISSVCNFNKACKASPSGTEVQPEAAPRRFSMDDIAKSPVAGKDFGRKSDNGPREEVGVSRVVVPVEASSSSSLDQQVVLESGKGNGLSPTRR